MHTMSDTHPIAIVGGGPVGLACALLLHAQGLKAQVFDARTAQDAQRDARVLALSRGSWSLLQPLLTGITLRRADITEVHVSSAGEFGQALLPSREKEPLGATVRYGELVTALAQAVKRADIDVQHQATVCDVQQSATQVRLQFEDGHTLDAPLAVLAEGGAARPNKNTDWAIVTSVQISGLAPGVAVERFTREGPLALLPEPSLSNAAPSMSLVWCMSEAQCSRRTSLPETAFLDELQHALGPRIGAPTGVGPRHRFPLTQHLEPRVHRHRVVRIGNAAQTLHPVAGQGFNLGLRDGVVLARALAEHPTHQALSLYARQRAPDRRVITSLTQVLPALFATDFTPLALARSAGLMALDLIPALRHRLAHVLMFGVRI